MDVGTYQAQVPAPLVEVDVEEGVGVDDHGEAEGEVLLRPALPLPDDLPVHVLLGLLHEAVEGGEAGDDHPGQGVGVAQEVAQDGKVGRHQDVKVEVGQGDHAGVALVEHRAADLER